MCLTVGGDGEDGAVEDVHGDVCGVGRGGLTSVDARVGVLDVADDEARDGAAAGVVLKALSGGGGPRPGRRRGGGSGPGVEEDHLRRVNILLVDAYLGLAQTFSMVSDGVDKGS